jgi:hypothetical protein
MVAGGDVNLGDALEEIGKRLRKLDGTAIKVGSMGEGGGPTATLQGTDLPVAAILAYHEFGAGGLPERSVIRAVLHAERDAVAALMGEQIKGVLLGETTVDAMWDAVGQYLAEAMRSRIRSGITPALQPETLQDETDTDPNTRPLDDPQILESLRWARDDE